MNELDLFMAANAIVDPAERAAFLDRACADQPVLRQRLEALLAGNAQSRHPLDQPPSHPLAPADATGTFGDPVATGSYRSSQSLEAEGVVIAGRYKLRQQIGEGGMGTVWMAEQTEPVKRKVAVKLIRVERGQSKTILARFDAERQAIALMDHPNIAKLLDAGTTETGSPYFVMELVKGIPLNEFCDQHKLTITERLTVFTQICSAVQHAHQKGIIHRDLKPGNILIESHDGKPVPKVIDFGLAKATTGLQLTEQSMYTAFGSVMGTPLYMAPEQANFNAIDIDTRADVYALGVILYELLTGTTPIMRESLKKAALDEMLRLIREQEAPSPSSRLSSADSTPSVAANRQIEPAKLGRFVKGELDWIVLKALSKERDRRYESANNFAKDIERFLNHEPVAAGPPSASYRLKKFVRRNRGQVVAASLVFLALVAGVVGTTWQAYRAKLSAVEAIEAQATAQAFALAEAQAKEEAFAQRGRAETAAQNEKIAREQTQLRLKQVEKGNATLRAIFKDLDINQVKKGDEPLEAVLATRLVKAAEQIEGDAVGDPLDVAQLQAELAHTLVNLGHLPEAVVLFEKALATFNTKLGPDHDDSINCSAHLVRAYLTMGKVSKSLPLSEEITKRLMAKYGPDHITTLRSQATLGSNYSMARQNKRALPLLEDTLMKMKQIIPPGHEDYSAVIVTMYDLAGCYLDLRRGQDGIRLFEEVLSLMRQHKGPDHPDTLQAINSLAVAYQSLKILDKALPLGEELYERSRAKLGPTHPDTLLAAANLGVIYSDSKKHDAVIALLETNIPRMVTKFGPGHHHSINTQRVLAKNYLALGQPEKAIAVLESVLAAMTTRFGPDHNQVATSQLMLSQVYLQTKQGEKAKNIIQQFLEQARKKSIGKEGQFASMLAGEASKLLIHEQWVYSEELLRECLGIREKAEPQLWSTFNTMSMLGGALLGQKKYTDAEPLLLKGYEGMKVRFDKTPEADPTRLAMQARIPESLDRLIALYTQMKKPDEVKKYQQLRAEYPAAKVKK